MEHPDEPITVTLPRSWFDALATAAAACDDQALTTDPTLTAALAAIDRALMGEA